MRAFTVPMFRRRPRYRLSASVRRSVADRLFTPARAYRLFDRDATHLDHPLGDCPMTNFNSFIKPQTHVPAATVRAEYAFRRFFRFPSGRGATSTENKYVCITANQPDTKSNPDPNPNPTPNHTAKQLALVYKNSTNYIVTFPTYAAKFILHNVVAPFLQLSVAVVYSSVFPSTCCLRYL